MSQEFLNSVDFMIKHITGSDELTSGMVETPKRVYKAFQDLCIGYNKEPKDVFKTFDNDENYDQIIILKDIEMFSICEHHLLPFFGRAHIGYIPGDKIIGISKLARLLDIYAKRFQVQERIGEQVTNDIMKYLRPKGVGCIIEATHMCVRMRGVAKQHSVMKTSSLKGVFLYKKEVKNEFLKLVG